MVSLDVITLGVITFVLFSGVVALPWLISTRRSRGRH